MKKVIVFVFGFFLIGISQATIIYVPSDVPTIQAGIDTAAHGDTVLVDVGSYVEHINFNGKNLVLGSWFLVTGDPSYISQTVIDGDSSGSVVIFYGGEDSSAVLSGFTITNGEGYLVGGGISLRNSSALLHNVVVSGNRTRFYGSGGGIYCLYSNLTLENVDLSKNSASRGGGIWCLDSEISYENGTISGNLATGANEIYGAGGGIFLEESRAFLKYMTIWGNRVMGAGKGGYDAGGGIAYRGGIAYFVNEP